MPLSEAEQVFYHDIHGKKRTASEIRKGTPKRGFTKNLRFPSDIMSRKEKYNYRKAGKVMTTNLFDEILSIEDFQELETHEKKNRMQYWRTNKSANEIQKAMGIAAASYYRLIKELDLPVAKRTNRQRKAVAKVEQKTKPEVKTEQVQEIIVNGLSLMYNGTYSPDEIQRLLSKFSALLEGETDNYYLELRLMQK